MKPKQGALLIGLILAVAATALLLLLPASPNLYIAYVGCMLGIALLIAGALSVRLDDAPASYGLLRQSGKILPCSLAVSAAALILEATGAFALPPVWHAAIQAAIFLAFGIRLIAMLSGRTYVGQVGKRAGVQTARLAALCSQVDALQPRADLLPEERRAEAKQALRQVSEALKYSDPMGANAAEERDARIANAVGDLAGLCAPESADRLVEACGALCAAIRERNDAVKIGK